jgi:O-antigen/teichoic acid export membrane protein
VNAATSFAAKFASVAVTLLAVPATLAYLGPERFGVWITVTSFQLLLSFCDLGIGNGLMTAISHESGRDDILAIRRHVSGGFVAMSAIALGIGSIFALSYWFVPWADALNIKSPGVASELGPTMVVFVVGFCASIPAGIAGRVQTGLQQSSATSLSQIAGSVFSLIALFTAIRMQLSLPWFVGASVGGSVVSSTINSICFFGFWRRDLRPDFALIKASEIWALMHLGLLFFVLQLSLAIGTWTDNLIVMHTLGPEAVAAYSIPARLFAMVTMGVSLLMMPLWPAYGEALVSGDREWIRRTLLRSLRFSLLAAILGAGALVFSANWILDLWVNGRIHVDWSLAVAFAVATVVDCLVTSIAPYMNGTGVIGFQVIMAVSYAVACLVLRLIMVRWIGIAGIPLATALAYFLTTALPSALFLRSREFSGRETSAA